MLDELINNNIDIDELLSRGIDENELYDKCAKFFNMELIDLDKHTCDIYPHKEIPLEILEKYNLMIFHKTPKTIKILTPYPTNNPKLELMTISGKKIDFSLCMKSSIKKYLFSIKESIPIHNSNHTPNRLDLILENGVSKNASDIHFEYKYNNFCVIRYRIHGDLYRVITLQNDKFKELISAIKLQAKVDVLGATKPKDGRFSKLINGVQYDFRVSSIPLYNGESLVIRILKSKHSFKNIESINLPIHSLNLLKHKSSLSNGLILFTGPTGSGKTTTLYAILNEITKSNKKIITIEDPVEYELEGSEQIQASEHNNISFVNILKSVLRHDPDIIMIGEIRDSESLKITIESSLSGHLVLSTLHTKDAISTIIRLKEMGVSDYILYDSISCIHSSRLVKKLCSCKNKYTPNQDILNLIKTKPNQEFYQKNGCEVCYMSGYIDRVSISETLEFTKIFHQNTNNANHQELLEIAKNSGFKTMLDDGIEKAKKGIVDIQDVIYQSLISS